MHRKALNADRTAIMWVEMPTEEIARFETMSAIGNKFPLDSLLVGARGTGPIVTAKEEVGADEGIQIAVHNLVHITALKFCAVVLDEVIRLHGVGANLAAEADFGFRGVELMEGFAALFEFEFVKLRAENFHSPFAILVLAAFILALNDDAGRKMGDADGGFDFVDVLPPVAAGAEGIDAKIVGLDHDVDFVVGFRDYEDGGDRCVAACSLIEGRDAHQAMHATFTGQHSVRVFTRDLHGGCLYARFFAGS